MSQENNGVSNTPDENVSDVSQETQETTVSDSQNQTVQYHTHKKALSQLKKKSAELEELREQISSLTNEKLEAEGNKDKLIESLREQVKQKDSRLRNTVGTIAQKNASTAIVEEAVKLGCKSPAIVKKFLADKIDTLQFTEDFEPDRDQIIELVQEAKLEAPELFGKEAAKLANHNTSRGSTVDKTKTLRKMNMDDLFETLGETL